MADPAEIHPTDLATCRALLQTGSKTFFAASLLLPKKILHPATALYAFCRIADDIIDQKSPLPPAGKGWAEPAKVPRSQRLRGMPAEGRVPEKSPLPPAGEGWAEPAKVPRSQRLRGMPAEGRVPEKDPTQHTNPPPPLKTLHHRLDAIYANTPPSGPDHAPDRALAATVQRHRIPRALLDGLLEGFAWDAAGRQYEDLAELQAYAARVAGTVGAMMAVLMGVRAPHLVARACDLGVAMQLSNIARDVGEDARAGRLYLPRRWLREAGIDPDAWLANPIHTPALGDVVQRLVRAADTLYARAEPGIAALPRACRPGIGAASRLYAAIGHRVAQAGGNAIDTRATVPLTTKLALLAAATAATLRPPALFNTPPTAPPLPAVRHLVAAVTNTPPPQPPPGRLVWLLELFADLDTRQTLRSTP